MIMCVKTNQNPNDKVDCRPYRLYPQNSNEWIFGLVQFIIRMKGDRINNKALGKLFPCKYLVLFMFHFIYLLLFHNF